MICCLCGKQISDERLSCNPFPLCCADEDRKRCCQECDFVYVTPARLHMHLTHMKHRVQRLNPQVGDTIYIFHCKTSNVPMEYFQRNQKTISGIITSRNGNTLFGTWGNYAVDVENDSYGVIDV